jgi:uncharacterized membrane protein YfcA
MLADALLVWYLYLCERYRCVGRPEPDVTPIELVLLALVALATSMLSAVVGFGGGILLLAALASVIDPLAAIVVQGAIQLVGNTARAHAHHRAIDWSVVARLTVLVIPGSVLGLLVARDLEADTIRALMGGFILLVTWWPAATTGLARHVNTPTLVSAGAVAGFGNVTVGATGPLLAPFFRAATANRLAFVGTFAAAQALGHLVKLITLSAGGATAIGDHLPLVAAGVVAVVIGTRLGTRVLRGVSEQRFGKIQRVVLTLLAVRLLVGVVV